MGVGFIGRSVVFGKLSPTLVSQNSKLGAKILTRFSIAGLLFHSRKECGKSKNMSEDDDAQCISTRLALITYIFTKFGGGSLE